MELAKRKPSKSGRLSAEAEEALLSQLVEFAEQGLPKATIQARLGIGLALFNRLYIRALEESRITAILEGNTLQGKDIALKIRKAWNVRKDATVSFEIVDGRVILTLLEM